MSQISYSNFKNGLDTRRSELTTQPGSLLQLQDAHVNEGAEIEKRRALLNASYVPLNTYGLEITSTGPIVFSDSIDNVVTVSRAETATTATLVLAESFVGGVGDNIFVTGLGNSDYNGSWVIKSVSGTTITFDNNSGNTESTTPDVAGTVAFDSWYNGITYQQLEHPAVYLGATYNASLHAMTGVAASTSFGGYAWVAATFSDGNTYTYWNGVPIAAFYNGTVLNGWSTNVEIAEQLSLAIAGVNGFYTNWSGGDNTFNFWSDVGINFSPVIGDPNGAVTTVENTQTVTNGTGTLKVTQLFNPTPAASGIQAIGSFYLFGGSTGSVTHVKVNGVDIMSGAVPFNSTIGQTALDVATAINSYVASPLQYTATANSTTGQIFITAVASGTTPNGYVVGVVVTGNIIFDNAAFALPSISSDSCTAVTPAGGSNLLSGTVTCSGTNYTAWAQAIAANITANSGSNGGFIAYAGTTGQTVYISRLSTTTSQPVNYTVTLSSGSTTDASYNATSNSPLTVALAVPSSQTVTRASTSQTESLNVAGGVAPYTYLWVIASDQIVIGGGSGGNGSAVLVNPAFSTTAIQNLVPNETVTIYCTVTDSTSPTKLSVRSPTIIVVTKT